MRIINTASPMPSDPMGQLALYSGMDNLTLFEINDQLDSLLTPTKRKTYEFEMGLQAPLLEMSFNGVKVDQDMRRKLIREHEQELQKTHEILHQFCEAIGYYNYYLTQGILRIHWATDIPMDGLPRSWEEWTLRPIQWRKQVKALNPKALTEYHKTLKSFGPPYIAGNKASSAFNARSSVQKLRLLYDFFGHSGNTISQALSPDFPPPWNQTRGIKEIRTRDAKGEYTPSADRECLEKIQARGLDYDHKDAHFWALPFVNCCLEIMDIGKTLDFLRCKLEEGYFRSSFAANTVTGRLASSENAQGFGSNAQNITPRLRLILEAEKRWKLGASDYEQIESRIVGAICYRLFGATAYLNATESGDLHTLVCSMVWEDKPWPKDFTLATLERDGPFPKDMIKAAKAIAKQELYRGKSMRDGSKTLGHGCLTGDHEVLTPSGWQPISKKPAMIMQGNGIFAYVSNWIDKEYDGKFVEWEGQSISVKMTEDHRVYYSTTNNKEICVKPASKVPASGKVLLGQNFQGLSQPPTFSGCIHEPLADLYAAYHCDGWHDGYNSVKFHFHKQRKKDRIKALAVLNDIDWVESGNRITLRWRPTFDEPHWGMLNWDYESLYTYMTELPYWDGHFGKTSTSLHSKNYSWLEMWQTFNRLLGFGGNIQKPQISGFGTKMYSLQVNNRKLANRVSFTEDHLYDDIEQVYCPTVPTQNFYVRRNGKIHVTGNSNYLGQPRHMAKQSHIPFPLVEHFQEMYFGAFPELRRWQQWVAEQVQTIGEITTMLGRTRRFFGRPNEDKTIRDAVAFEPQSVAADYTDSALLDLYKASKRDLPIKVFLQKHDEIGFRFREEDEELTIPRIVSIMERHITITNPAGEERDWFAPAETMVGWNLGYRKDRDKNGKKLEKPINPDGLIVLTNGDDRTRERDSSNLLLRTFG